MASDEALKRAAKPVPPVTSLNRDKLDQHLRRALQELGELTKGSVSHEVAIEFLDRIRLLLESLRGAENDIPTAVLNLGLLLEAMDQVFRMPRAGDAPSTDEIQKITQAHTDEIAQLTAAHQAELEKLKSGHRQELTTREREQQQRLAELRVKIDGHVKKQREVETACADARAETAKIRAGADAQGAELRGKLAANDATIAGLRTDNDAKAQTIAEMEAQRSAQDGLIEEERTAYRQRIELLNAEATKVPALEARNSELEALARVSAQELLGRVVAYVSDLQRLVPQQPQNVTPSSQPPAAVSQAIALPQPDVGPSLATIRADLEAYQERCRLLHEEISQTTDRLAGLTTDMAEAKLRATTAQTDDERSDAQRQHAELSRQHTALEKHRGQLAEALQTAEAAARKLGRYAQALEIVQQGLNVEPLQAVPAAPALEEAPRPIEAPPATQPNGEAQSTVQQLATAHSLTRAGVILATLFELIPVKGAFKNRSSGLTRVRNALDQAQIASRLDGETLIELWLAFDKNFDLKNKVGDPQAGALSTYVDYSGVASHKVIYSRTRQPLPWQVDQIFTEDEQAAFVSSFEAVAPQPRAK